LDADGVSGVWGAKAWVIVPRYSSEEGLGIRSRIVDDQQLDLRIGNGVRHVNAELTCLRE